jgi:3-oxoadipate enol-lactonase
MGESMRDRIPGAKLAVLEAAHISNVEQPKAYTETVLKFLNG